MLRVPVYVIKDLVRVESESEPARAIRIDEPQSVLPALVLAVDAAHAPNTAPPTDGGTGGYCNDYMHRHDASLEWMPRI